MKSSVTQPSQTNGLISPTWDFENVSNFGPHIYGAKLHIDEPINNYEIKSIYAVDCETDERDNFVGLAVCNNSTDVYYFTKLELAVDLLARSFLVGHNLKGDLKWLRRWGVKISHENLGFDTMVASYVINPVKDSHGLKPLAKDILSMSWPTYAQIVGKGRKRQTLDKKPIKLVGNYCGMDCLATWKLYEHFVRVLTPNQRRIFQGIEMPINRILFQMEEEGVKIDLKLLDQLDVTFAAKIAEIISTLHSLTSEEIEKLLVKYRYEQLKEKWEQSGYKAFEKSKKFNPGSWQQKRLLLKFMGLELDTTDKRTLIKFKDKNKLINLLLQHSEFSKLYNTFICGFKELDTLPVIHTTYSQVSEDSNDEDQMHGLSTGRLSSKNPNLQQIPARTENGKFLRKLFIPRDGHTFIVADYSQIELRLAAHFSHDPILCEAFRLGQDVHEATAKALGVDRFYGKTGNFLLAFGGSYWRLMDSLNLGEQQARDFYKLYWDKFRILALWKDRAVNVARLQGGVKTLASRFIPVEGLRSNGFKERSMSERFAISGIVQGSAADILKLAMINCWDKGYKPILTVHDELVFETDKPLENCESEIKNIMENIVKLDVPLEVVIGHGLNWGECKK